MVQKTHRTQVKSTLFKDAVLPTESQVWNTAETSWSVWDENHFWFHISGHYHSLEGSSLSCGASPASSSSGRLISDLSSQESTVGLLEELASIRSLFCLLKDWLPVRRESRWRGLCGHSCLSHKKDLFTAQARKTKQDLCLIKGPL